MTRSRSFSAVESSQVAKATSGRARGGLSGTVDGMMSSVLEPGRKGFAIGGNEAGRGTNVGRDKEPGQVRSVGERV
ncbi:hypothetical protein DHEL01_v210872 [Diaporthe helianthi]|uniref:Uncharacterized protein n=1 Tax=Diaporthe helianthi TaxID=158607 RepID=A0A2P5HKG1_DIAHE|nr:hypothetical protein DHEL01_v210872 [Diaporthe helianthi]